MTQSRRILIIEDDARIRRLLELSLKQEGYKVDSTGTCQAGRMLLQSNRPDLVLLDLGLPDGDGIEFLDGLDAGEALVIVVTSRDRVDQKVAALDAGACDYVVKPFDIKELFARIRAALRMRPDEPEAASLATYTCGGLEVNFETHTTRVDDAEVHLTPNEYKLLKVLIENRGKVLTHRVIQREVWGSPSYDEYRTLRVLVTSLRRKLNEKPSFPKYIKTEVGVGYRFIGE